MMKFVQLAIVIALISLSNPVYAEADIDAIRAAANGGNVAAMTTMGSLYFRGYLVQQDDAQALQWYLLAASQGHAGAQTIVGMMLLQDGDEGGGKYWLRSAAIQGDPVAQRQLDLLKKKQD